MANVTVYGHGARSTTSRDTALRSSSPCVYKRPVKSRSPWVSLSQISRQSNTKPCSHVQSLLSTTFRPIAQTSRCTCTVAFGVWHLDCRTCLAKVRPIHYGLGATISGANGEITAITQRRRQLLNRDVPWYPMAGWSRFPGGDVRLTPLTLYGSSPSFPPDWTREADDGGMGGGG